MNPIEIVLPKQYYAPGEVVFGKVRANFSQPFNAKGLSIVFCGQARTEISHTTTSTETQGVGTSWQKTVTTQKTRTSRSVKTFVSQSLNLEGPGPLSSMKEYPFIFTIPPNAPPSFKDRFGKLTYQLVATTLKEKLLQRRYYATVDLIVPPLTPPPLPLYVATKNGVIPYAEITLDSQVTTPEGTITGNLVVSSVANFRKMRVGIRVDWWAYADGDTEQGHHDQSLGEYPLINIQPGVPIGINIRLNSPPNSMTFVDGSIYIHQTFLTITLGKGVDFIIPVEIGYPTPEAAVQRVPIQEHGLKAPIIDPNLRLEDFVDIPPAMEITEQEALDMTKEDESTTDKSTNGGGN